MPDEPLVRVAFTQNQAESDLIENILREEGIPSLVRRTRGFDVPDFLAAGPRDVLVHASRAEAARALLRDADVAETVEPLSDQSVGDARMRILLWVVAGAALAGLVAWLLTSATG